MQASHGSDINGNMYYMPNTHFTDIKQSASRHKSHSTVRYYTSQDLNAVRACSLLTTSNDLCVDTFGRIMDARSKRGLLPFPVPHVVFTTS